MSEGTLTFIDKDGMEHTEDVCEAIHKEIEFYTKKYPNKLLNTFVNLFIMFLTCIELNIYKVVKKRLKPTTEADYNKLYSNMFRVSEFFKNLLNSSPRKNNRYDKVIDFFWNGLYLKRWEANE